MRRLNFDYKLEFVSEPDSGTVVPISNTNGPGKMYFPFRIVNMWTGKEVGISSNDYGALDASPIDYQNGAADYVWTPGEDIFLIQDSLRIAGAWLEAYNYNLELLLPVPNSQKNGKHTMTVRNMLRVIQYSFKVLYGVLSYPLIQVLNRSQYFPIKTMTELEIILGDLLILGRVENRC